MHLLGDISAAGVIEVDLIEHVEGETGGRGIGQGVTYDDKWLIRHCRVAAGDLEFGLRRRTSVVEVVVVRVPALLAAALKPALGAEVVDLIVLEAVGLVAKIP